MTACSDAARRTPRPHILEAPTLATATEIALLETSLIKEIDSDVDQLKIVSQKITMLQWQITATLICATIPARNLRISI